MNGDHSTKRNGMNGGMHIAGAYQPRPKGSEFSDTLSEAYDVIVRLIRLALVRGAGAVVFLAAR